MARGTRKGPKQSKSGRSRVSNGRARTAPDAIALLKADHRLVEEWFAQFQKTDSMPKKHELAENICTALKVHTTIEEEIFYPAFLEATDEEAIHHEAEVEHDGAKKLIAELEAGGPQDDYFDAKVTVLSEMIKHHVKEEEKRGGMFAKARQSDMDLMALGEQLQQRKDEVMAKEQKSGARPAGRRNLLSRLAGRSA